MGLSDVDEGCDAPAPVEVEFDAGCVGLLLVGDEDLSDLNISLSLFILASFRRLLCTVNWSVVKLSSWRDLDGKSHGASAVEQSRAPELSMTSFPSYVTVYHAPGR